MSNKDKSITANGDNNQPPKQGTKVATPPKEKSSSADSKPTVGSNKNKSSSFKWLIILVILAGLTYVSYWAWQQWQDYQIALQQDDSQQKFEQSLASQKNALSSLQQQQKQAQQNSQQQIDGLQRQLESMQAELVTTQRKFQVSNKDQQQEWKLAEIEFLIKQASQKLYFSDDYSSLIALLQTADQQVVALADNQLLPLRQALAQDIQNIRATNQIDYDGIILKLNALKQTVGQLELASVQLEDPALAEQPASTEEPIEQSSWEIFTSKIDSSLSKYYKVHHYKESAKPFISPKQDQLLRQNILLNLQIAQLSALRKDSANYHNALQELSSWTLQYFKQATPAAQAFAAQIDELSSVQFSQDKPSSLTSLTLVQEIMSQRLNNFMNTQSSSEVPTQQSQATQEEALEKENQDKQTEDQEQ